MKFIYCFLLIFCITKSSAQKLSMTNSFGGVRFSIDTVEASPKQVLKFLEGSQPAHDNFKKAMVNRNFAGVLGFAGGLLIGLPIGSLIGGGDVNWGLAGGGLALLAISIPIDNSQRRQFQKIVDQYNGVGTQSRHIQTKLFLSAAGAKLVIRF